MRWPANICCVPNIVAVTYVIVLFSTPDMVDAQIPESLFLETFDEDILPDGWFGDGRISEHRVGENGEVIQEGSYVLQPTTDEDKFAGVTGDFPADQSIRLQIRAADDPVGDWIYFGAHANFESNGTYWGGVGTNGNLYIGREFNGVVTVDGSHGAELDGADWVNLRLDAVDDQIRLWGWQASESQPIEPQLRLAETRARSGGLAGISYNPRSTTNQPAVEINSIEIISLEEFATGDINRDLAINILDVNDLCRNISGETFDETMDLSVDGVLDRMDLDVLLETSGSLTGDTDLNGKVEFADFLTLSEHFGSRSRGRWDRGDFDCNGRVEFADFLLLADRFGLTAADSLSVRDASVSSVPEPGMHVNLLTLFALGLCRRKCRPN